MGSTDYDSGSDSGYTSTGSPNEENIPKDLIPLPPKNPATKVLDLDLKTPDHHVKRDERMIRLTGVHPFNVEAPLTTLFNCGFLTPAALHYVRNHGAVPKVLDEECMSWAVEISGMVEEPFTVTLAEIMNDFEQITLPVTLVCAGNRRKEQNILRKGSGFNWGSAGVSTSLWTGPLLGELIAKAKPKRGAKFVCMEGADALPNGCYGTSIRLSWVMDPNRGIQIAYKQNGQPLEPDHGKPVRVVIPGVIGGRSVKWLKKLIVSPTPSDNYYHIYDNRVLPTMVTPEMAKNEKKWWKDERYAIMDLNVQSATVYPAHDETLTVDDGSYTVRGYAYSGGGIRVGRVELSLDGGRSWRLASIEYPEDRYRQQGITELYGGRLDMLDRDTSFCWCFWKIDVEISELANAKDIVVRAMDENMNIQPRDMYWNVMSMLNNWWFRVAIIKEDDHLRFEHPTQAALIPGGWMPRVKAAGGNLLSSTYGEEPVAGDEPRVKPDEPKVVMTREDALQKTIIMSEVEQHDGEEQPWFVVNGQVYDGTGFLKEHPGGAESIFMAAGGDATDDFMAIHSETAKNMLVTYHIGRLAASDKVAEASTYSNEKRETFLHPKKWIQTKVLSKQAVSHDSRLIKFELEHPEQTSGLPVGNHIFIRLKDNAGDFVMRAYTPVSCHRTSGVLELLIKVYFPSEGNAGGKMTMLLDKLEVGDKAEIKGPLGSFQYIAPGVVNFKGKERKVKSFCMVSGGSGITPCYQVLKEVRSNKDDKTEVILLNGNRNEDDILCREELDSFHCDNVQIHHSLSGKCPKDWKHERGRYDLGRMDAKFGPERQGRMLLVCGPPGMVDSVKQYAEKHNWSQEDVVYF